MRAITPILLLTTLSLTSPFALPSLSNQIIDNPVLIEQIQPVKLPVKAKPKKKATFKHRAGCNGVYDMARYVGATKKEANELRFIAKHESGCRMVKNSSSSAYGWFQFMYNTWRGSCRGSKFSTKHQTKCALQYIRRGQTYDTWYRWWPKHLRPARNHIF